MKLFLAFLLFLSGCSTGAAAFLFFGKKSPYKVYAMETRGLVRDKGKEVISYPKTYGKFLCLRTEHLHNYVAKCRAAQER